MVCRSWRTSRSRPAPGCSCVCRLVASAARTSRSSGRAAAGTVLGHEVAGELENGARVTVMHRVPCGTCDRCLAGHQSTCGEFRELRIAPGGFAEQLRASHCVPLPDSVGDHDGIWVEPLACVLRAAELVPPRPGARRRCRCDRATLDPGADPARPRGARRRPACGSPGRRTRARCRGRRRARRGGRPDRAGGHRRRRCSGSSPAARSSSSRRPRRRCPSRSTRSTARSSSCAARARRRRRTSGTPSSCCRSSCCRR